MSFRLFKSFVVTLALLTPVLVPSFSASASSASTSGFSFRAVLCYAPPLSTKTAFPSAAAIPTCTSAYRLTEKNLGVKPGNSASGFTMKTVKPDPRFLRFRNTSLAKIFANSEILLPGIHGTKVSQRFVLGRSQLTNSSIKSAKAERQSLGSWVVAYRLTSSGKAVWNAFAKLQFHGLFAVVANGLVYSAPVIQPSLTKFASFGASGVISGNFTKAEALALAALMQPAK
jgi:SecD-like export protein